MSLRNWKGARDKIKMGKFGRVAELVDVLVLGTSGATRGGSSPLSPTMLGFPQSEAKWKFCMVKWGGENFSVEEKSLIQAVGIPGDWRKNVNQRKLLAIFESSPQHQFCFSSYD